MLARLAPLALAVSTLLCASACAGKVQDPIPTAPHLVSEAATAPVLLVMLPGAGDRVGTYDKHGLVEAMRATGMEVDMLEVDAHPGYYYGSRTLLERMDQDVLAPNRGRYEQIWIVGISMGGIGALLTAWTYPEDITGLILMSPYLGRRKTLKGISKAGGLAAWQPPAEVDEDAWDVEIWRKLKHMSEGEDPLDLYLMYGHADLGVKAHNMLAAALPEDHVKTTPGGHAWSTWSTLWATLLAERPFE